MRLHACAALALLLAPLGSTQAGSATNLEFERLWPAQQQPYFFNFPTELLFDSNDQLLVVDRGLSRISRYSPGGRAISAQTVRRPNGDRELIADAATAADGTMWLANGFFLSRLPPGESQYIFEPVMGLLEFNRPESVAVSPGGDIFVRTQGEFAGAAPEVTSDIPSEVFRFDRELNFINSWVISPTAVATLKGRGLAVGPDESVYLTGENEVIKYNSQGVEQTRWGSQGSGPGQFEFDLDAADGLIGAAVKVDRNGLVYVADIGNGRVQVFDADGGFVRQLGSPGSGNRDGTLNGPTNLAISSTGDVFVLGQGLQLFSSSGEFRNTFANFSEEPGFFDNLSGVAVSTDSNVYSAQWNGRVQRFDANGRFEFEFSAASGLLFDVDTLSDGRIVLAAATINEPPIGIYDVSGNLLNTFGPPTGPARPLTAALDTRVAVDGDDNIYLVAITRDEILKFNADGQQLLAFSSSGNGNGEVFGPLGIDVDSAGMIYVADALGPGPNDRPRLQKFDAEGNYLLTFEDSGAINLGPIAAGNDGRLYVSHSSDAEVGVYNQETGAFLGTLGGPGIGPGQLSGPRALDFGPSGELYVSDQSNLRITKYAPNVGATQNARAIVVAAGGPYPGNALWDATQGNASFAVRALANRGFSKQTIQYLSADTQLDLDQNGEADDVDGDATVANLQSAILGPFAEATDELVLYLVDHGGENTFRMSGTETLDAGTLASWLDSWQNTRPGSRLTIIYDACQSGSFLDELANPVFDRVVIASAQASENAYFVSAGTLSFSNHFWSQVFNGRSLEQAFSFARSSQSQSFPLQNPLADANGDGQTNSGADLALLSTRFIGTGGEATGEVPVITSVSAPQTISSGNSATVAAFGVTDDGAVARVWTVIRPPGFNPGSPDNPISALPSFDLLPDGNGNYEATFDGFSDPGTYQLTVYAMDTVGNTGQPMTTQVVVDNPLGRKAVVIVGGDPGDPGHADAVANGNRVYRALLQQGYGQTQCDVLDPICDATCDNVCFLKTELAVTAGGDSATTRANVQQAIEGWGITSAQDLTVYLAAAEDGGAYQLGAGEILTANALKGHLDNAQQILGGTVTVVVEGNNAGAFTAQLTPSADQPRILIASSDAGEESVSLIDGEVSFSKFFWNQVLNGDTVRNAFDLASAAIRFNAAAQRPQLDDNGNGISNELLDGQTARFYAIGNGVLLAGDDPLLGPVSVNGSLVSDFETISLSQVTSTGTIERVASVVTRPDGSRVTQTLTQGAAGFSARSFGLCSEAGSYEMAVYAIDDEGATSMPATASAERAADCSDFLFFSGFE